MCRCGIPGTMWRINDCRVEKSATKGGKEGRDGKFIGVSGLER